MYLVPILFTLIGIVPTSSPSPMGIVGTWSEFGCDQDQIIIKSSGQITTKLWAGDEYGWLSQYRYWSSSEESIEIRSKRYKHSDVVEQWTISEHLDKELMISRKTADDDPRAIRLVACD